MASYDATVTREGGWLVITIEGVGTTQADSEAEVSQQAAGLVEAMTGRTDVEIRLHYADPPAG